MEANNILLAFILTFIAGLSTGLGGLIASFSKRDNTNFLSVSLGFSAGVMLFVSFVDLFPESQHALEHTFGEYAMMWTMMFFFVGVILIAAIDFLIPAAENPHEFKALVENNDIGVENNKFKKMGIFLALAIAIHNFPEGFATFAVALQGIEFALPIIIAIALHNIPEGIAVYVPIYQATGSKSKAFKYSLLSGLAEPLGAVVGYLALMSIWNETIEGALLAMTAGIMVYISLDELLPSAEKYGKHHLSIIGVVLGMMFMALSMILVGH